MNRTFVLASALFFAPGGVSACVVTSDTQQEEDGATAVAESAIAMPEPIEPTTPAGGSGTPSGEACSDCYTSSCFASYANWYTAAFAEPPPANQQTSGGAGGAASSNTYEQDLQACYQVGTMTFDDTFDCKDFSKWFLLCMKQRGRGPVIGLSMNCKSCDDGEGKDHRIVMYKKPNGQWCPGEPQLEKNGEASTCCSEVAENAADCALTKYCSGRFPFTDDQHPKDPDYDGCKDGRHKWRTCATCFKESCSAAQEAQVCHLIQ